MRSTRRDSADSKENKRRSATTNHYAVMGIQDFARGSEAKRAYHRLALEWHPDRQIHAPEHRQKEAEDVFKACISELFTPSVVVGSRIFVAHA